MKKVFYSCIFLFVCIHSQAQQMGGKVTYERTVEITISGVPGVDKIPKTRINKFELNFAKGQMICKQLEDELPDESTAGNVMIRSIATGADDVIFADFSQSRKVEQREFMDRKFLVSDSLRPGKWKLTGETRTILNHVCRQAISTRAAKRSVMSVENGAMTRKELTDTVTVIAWFTTDIPVAAGPESQGQLPGLILAMDINNGKTVYTAISLSDKPALSQIKEPVKGKKVTPEEYAAERMKLIEEMRKNNNGTIRFN